MVVEIDANRSAVFAVTDHVEATRRPLEDVRDVVAEMLKTEQAQSLMNDKANAMLEALETGQSFAEVAAGVGASAPEPRVMTRNAEDDDQSLAVAVFTALKPAQGKPTTGSTRNEAGGISVFSLDAVIPGRPEAIPLADRDAGRLQLADQSGIGDFVAFVQALRANADIAVNQDVLAAQDLFQ